LVVINQTRWHARARATSFGGLERAAPHSLPRRAGDQHHDLQLVDGAAALQRSNALAMVDHNDPGQDMSFVQHARRYYGARAEVLGRQGGGPRSVGFAQLPDAHRRGLRFGLQRA
jgi:hypothetical protein